MDGICNSLWFEFSDVYSCLTVRVQLEDYSSRLGCAWTQSATALVQLLWSTQLERPSPSWTRYTAIFTGELHSCGAIYILLPDSVQLTLLRISCTFSPPELKTFQPIDGDILVTAEQQWQLEELANLPYGRISKRAVCVVEANKWPNGVVPYEIDDSLSKWTAAMQGIIYFLAKKLGQTREHSEYSISVVSQGSCPSDVEFQTLGW